VWKLRDYRAHNMISHTTCSEQSVCSGPTFFQNSLPTWLPHWPTWMLMISLGMVWPVLQVGSQAS